jgi:hypothetical protein
MGDDPMALLGLEGALKHYYYYYVMSDDPTMHSTASAFVAMMGLLPVVKTPCGGFGRLAVGCSSTSPRGTVCNPTHAQACGNSCT